MTSPLPTRFRVGLSVLLAAGVAAVVFALPDARTADARSPEQPGAAAGPVRVAGSICEAQELKALAAERPDVRIEIPSEFDKSYPSLSACRAHAAAWDDAAPGPRQPIPFSHRHHAGEYQIPCQYCHSGTGRSRMAGVPSLENCMGCHVQFSPDFDELEGIRILKQHWQEKQPVAWAQIHRLPEHVKFRHNRHVAVGVDCNQCHGNLRDENPVKVERLDKLHLVPDTRWWKYGLPAKKLEMGWCIQCHRENQASQDCLTCHY